MVRTTLAKLRFTLTALAVTAAALALQPAFSFGQNAGAGGKTKIVVWHYFTEEQGKPFAELLEKFQKENADVEVVAYNQGKPFELRQKLEASFAASPGTNPVMSTVYENWTSAFLQRGLMDPVENYVGTPEGPSREDVADMVKAYREANTWDNKLITMPFAKSIYLMYLNMDKLAQAGITTAPESQAEWKQMVEKATQKQGRRVSTYGAGLQPQSEAFTTFYLARGAEFFDEKGNPIFDGPEGVAVLEMLKSLVRPDKRVYLSPDYMSTPFRNQLIASYIYSSASLPYNEKGAKEGGFKYATAPIPGVEGGQPGGKAVMQGMNFGVFKNRPEAERKAAMRLIKFLYRPENVVFWATRTGYMPTRYSAQNDPELQAYMASNPHYALASRLVTGDKGTQEPKIAEWDGIRNDLQQVVDQVLNRGADPQRLLTELKTKVAARLKETAGGRRAQRR